MRERLPAPYGTAISRATTISFRFEGRSCRGFEGDTISAALWANGYRILGRSFKYHRPRAFWGLDGIDSNVMVESENRTNIRGHSTLIEEGMNIRAVNTMGGVRFDLLGVLDKMSAFTPVGFYYKAFHSKRLFPMYERRIRALAGLGSVNTAKGAGPPTPKDYAYCDVLVVGSGPSGLAAALSAASAGAQVILVERNAQAGGTLTWQLGRNTPLYDLHARVGSSNRIDVRTGTVAAGCYADHWFALVDGTKMTKCRAKAVVFATGALEQPAVFRNNDLPGIMMGGSAQCLMHHYAVKPCKRAVVLTANADGYRVASELSEAGVIIQAIADLRPENEIGVDDREAVPAGVELIPAHTIFSAGKRFGRLSKVSLCGTPGPGDDSASAVRSIRCDGLIMSVGWHPDDGMLRQAGTTMAYDAGLGQFLPTAMPDGVFAAGRANGVYDFEDRMRDGEAAGSEAAAYLGLESGGGKPRPPRETIRRSHEYPVIPHPRGKDFLDLDEDVQVKDIKNAFQEGFDNSELMKRYSTVGMGPSQGNHGNVLALKILARLRGEDLHGKQTTTARPFITPLPMGILAGRTFTPRRRTLMHSWHQERNAKFMVAGDWFRPEFYAVEGKSREDCIRDEAINVRKNVGLIDLGTLGKIEISGADAVAFIESLYTGLFTKLKVGMSRYGVACDETGVVIDDGVVARLAEDRFYVSTTTSGSDAVYREMQRWAMIRGLDVVLVNATSAYGAMNLAGPKSMQLLQPLTDIDLSHEAFPYLAVREGSAAGVPARLSRVGFVGELGYEIHVPYEGALHVWTALITAGEKMGITPFGVEAQRLLRLEKGHIILGQDTDGLTQPYEAELDWTLKMNKPFFVGQRTLEVMKSKELTRQLVGFRFPSGYTGPLPEECHLILDGADIAGRVTSIGDSPTLGHPIGLAYVKPSQAEAGTRIRIRIDDGEEIAAEVVKIPFYDPEGERQKKESI